MVIFARFMYDLVVSTETQCRYEDGYGMAMQVLSLLNVWAMLTHV